MLKIEKISRNQQITIGFKKKNSFFNKALLEACFLAVILHLAGFLIFHIGPFKIMNSQILPPALVETDIFEEASTIAKIDPEKRLSRFPFAPTLKGPEFPAMPDLNLTDFMVLSQEINFLDNPFLNMENDLQHAHFFSKKNKNKPIKVVLSGDLANKKYEGDLSCLDSFKKIYGLYKVKVENKTGRIFWIEPMTAFLDEKQNEAIKKFLKEIRFEKIDHGFLTSGEIEIK